MALLKLAPFHAFKYFKWVDPDTGHKYAAADMPLLCAQIRTYRKQNELPELEFLESVVAHWLCRRPDHIGACEGSAPLKRGIIPSLKGGVLVLKNMMYNKFASQEVADERAAICKDCPLNIFPDKTEFVKWSDRIAENSVGDRKSKYHNELGNCDGCSCPMRAKVFYIGKLGLSQDEQYKMQQANPACWQIKEMKNE